MDKNSIYDNIIKSDEESFLELALKEGIKIERIVSTGQTSPEGFWYDQAQDEFVYLVQGQAIVEFEDKEVILKEGDYLNIKSHVKHRVKYTSKDMKTIWLAIFY